MRVRRSPQGEDGSPRSGAYGAGQQTGLSPEALAKGEAVENPKEP